MMKKLVGILPLFASMAMADISGQGLAECKLFDSQAACQKSAEQSALESLATQLYVEVASQTLTQANNQGENLFAWTATTQTRVPLLGTHMLCQPADPTGKRIDCEASMQLEQAATLYAAEMERLKANLMQQAKQQVSAEQALDHWQSMLADSQNYQKLASVMTLLAPSASVATLPLTVSELEAKVRQAQQQPVSLAQLAQFIGADITQSRLFINAPQYQGSQEVTPFAQALYQQLKSTFGAAQLVNEKDAAAYQLSVSYQTNPKHMDLAATLGNSEGKIILSRAWQVPKALYQQWQTEPQHLDFDRLLHQGYVVNDEFRVEVQTNKGNRNVLFEQGETARILIKLNRSGYVYILAHSRNDSAELSYLLELNDEAPPFAFERYIGPEDTNKWIDISAGGYEIMPPFGLESLEVFASESSFISQQSLPESRLRGDYYVVAGDPVQATTVTRGLVKKKAKTSQTAEAVLMITTRAKNEF